ncbi:gamma-glutamyltransferase family protein [Sulfurisphaera ohwakuensis]|uniref:gamma-glutamyltransferase family protein n=1 Tax=Sulfurisphaera ohwakuensis TaxID=69656 RepID=UPI0036F2D0CE
MKVAYGKKVVATQNYIASYVGAKVLENGGNAFDAAIAISATLSVVLPYTSGLGGDGFLLAKTPEGIIAYNGSGWAPKGLNVEKIPSPRHPSTVVVPGLVDLWNFLIERYTSMSTYELLKPAISLATNGFYVSKSLYKAIKNSSNMPESWIKTYGNLNAGDKVKLNEMGQVLKIIAKDPREFYEGKITEEIVSGLRKQGVNVDFSDFANFKGEEVKPLKTTYKDYTLYELPPNTQGISTLQALKLAELSNVNKLPYDDEKRINEHVKIYGIVYSDRNNYIADPRFYPLDVDLLDERYLRNRMKEFRVMIEKMNTQDTTFFVVSDGENEIGFIQSLFFAFGSGIVVKDIPFNNRGFGFTEGRNKPEPRKRPLHTLSILMAEKEDENLIIGCAGGDLRPQIHSQVFEYYADYGLEIDEAIDAPRFMFLGSRIVAEKRLKTKHEQLDYYSPEVGVVQALKSNKKYNIAVADPRSEGIALVAN